MSKLLIASGNGQLYKYDSTNVKIKSVFTTPNPNEWFMGLAKHQEKIVVSSTFGIHLFEWRDDQLFCLASMSNIRELNPRFQHIRTVGNLVFAASKSCNSIFMVNVNDDGKLDPVGRVILRRTAEVTYFDQISDIVFCDGKFYILLHNIATKPGESRLLEFSNSFSLTNYYDFGWGAHGLTITPEHKYVLCNYTPKMKTAGLVVDTKIKFSWKPEYKFKDMAITKDSIFIVGHAILEENDTTLNGGVVVELGHDYQVKGMKVYCGYGQFLGCMVIEEEDLANNTDQLSSDVYSLQNYKEDNIEVKLVEVKINDTISQSKD